ncbi:EAL domain-containing protein [Quadrisphaera sp. RL12-1S]|nr:EAL domain-containing protein [Quadrisphaera sp. RL12-1S]
MTEMHRTLERQLRRLGVDPAAAPAGDGWTELLAVVSRTYTEADEERYTLERSLEVSTREMRGLHDALSQRALQDALTGLPNRAALLAHLQGLLGAGRSGRGATALFVDLDGFKQVNDSLGHAAGDELLVRAAERIRSCLRPTDIVARLGGDEFVVVCEGADAEAAAAVASRVSAQLCTPFRVDGHDAVVSASIGLATAEGPGADAEQLLRCADLAMYDAKVAGKARTSVFDASMQSDVDSRVSVRSALSEGVRRGELRLAFQPQVTLADERLTGAEALVRWERPGHGLLTASSFVPAAAEGALVVEVDRWVVGEAVRRAATWCRGGRTLSVNVSPRTLESTVLVDELSTALHRWDVPARAVELEVGEAGLGRCSTAASRTLERLAGLGVGLAVDDFGTGSTSLAHLGRSGARTLKVDGSLVADVDTAAAAVSVVGAVVAMAHALGVAVVAEGVERRSQAEVLRELGCDRAQGFLFGSPGDGTALDARFGTARASAGSPAR